MSSLWKKKDESSRCKKLLQQEFAALPKDFWRAKHSQDIRSFLLKTAPLYDCQCLADILLAPKKVAIIENAESASTKINFSISELKEFYQRLTSKVPNQEQAEDDTYLVMTPLEELSMLDIKTRRSRSMSDPAVTATRIARFIPLSNVDRDSSAADVPAYEEVLMRIKQRQQSAANSSRDTGFSESSHNSQSANPPAANQDEEDTYMIPDSVKQQVTLNIDDSCYEEEEEEIYLYS